MNKPLAVALATCVVGFLPVAHGALQIRELFDGLTPSLQGAGNSSSSVGFEPGTTWAANRTGNINVADNFNVNPGVTNQMPVTLTGNGGIWWATPASGKWDSTWWGTRQLSAGARLDMNVDAVYYLTFNVHRRDDCAAGFGFASGSAPESQFLSIGITWNNTGFNPPANRKLAIAQGALNAGVGPFGANSYSTTQVNTDDRYVVLVKITTQASGNDTVQASFFHPNRAGFGALPAVEANITWDVTYSYADANVYTHLLAYLNGPNTSTELDAFRMGTSYGEVVQIAPLITQQPAPTPSATIYEGGAASMTVTATGGYPLPLTYQWFKDDTAITDATNATYQIVGATAAKAGAYYVVVTNVNGSVTSITNSIAVLDAPAAIVGQPQGGTRYPGGRITLAATYSGTLPIQFQWTHNGDVVPGATNATLIFTNLQPGDAGAYVLTATNALGGAASTPATITVLSLAAGSYEQFIMENGPVAYWRYNDGTPGTAADLAGGYNAVNTSVTYGSGVSQPTFPGFPTDNTAGIFDGTASASATTVSLMSNRRAFTIVGWFKPAVMPQMGTGNGRVALFGQNDAAELGFHSNTQLGIWTPGGGFVTFDPSTIITAGNWYMLSGVGDGTNITFYLNGNQAAFGGNSTTNYGSSSEPFRIGSAVLDTTGNFFNGAIDEVALFDHALSVDALNALYAKAAGIIPPTITSRPASLELYEGGTARFHVGVSGTLPFSYLWQKDGATISDGGTISGATTAEITIRNVTAADAGSYAVLVENLANFEYVEGITLTVNSRPSDAYAGLMFSNSAASWWQLNESAGSTVAHDYLSGRNGTYGGVATLGVPGPAIGTLPAGNTALQTGPAGSAVQLPPLNLNSNQMTIAAWIYPIAPGGGYRGIVFSRDGGTVSGLHFGDGNELRFTWNDASATWGWNSGLVVPSNQWSFVALTITPTNGTLYLGTDGQLRSAVNVVSNSNQGFTGATWIGEDPISSADRYFNGSIDEVAIFNRALSPREVGSLFLGAIEKPLSLSLAAATDVVADSKTSGTPHDGRNLGATWLAADSGSLSARSGVMSFASTSAQQIQIPANADFNSPTGAISFWMRSGGTSGEGNDGALLFDRRNGTGDVIVMLDDGSIFIQPEWMYGASSTKKVNDNAWHHIAYVYDQSTNGSIKVYIDGTLDISRANPRAWSWPANQQIEIGRSHDSWWKAFDGYIDDFRVYNQTMTDSGVAELMADSAGEPAAALMVRINFDAPPAGLLLNWPAGQLQSADQVNGPWQVVPGASAPWPVSTRSAARFYKALLP